MRTLDPKIVSALSPEAEAEREALDALVTSPGWALFEAHVEDMWGPRAYADRIEASVGGARTEAESHERVTALTAQRRAVRALAAWPRERVQTLALRTPDPYGEGANPYARGR
jgi:hypothetical protein